MNFNTFYIFGEALENDFGNQLPDKEKNRAEDMGIMDRLRAIDAIINGVPRQKIGTSHLQVFKQNGIVDFNDTDAWFTEQGITWLKKYHPKAWQTYKHVRQLDESLTAEKQLFDNPQDEFSIEIDEEDDNEGVIHYMGYEFPISKRNVGGHIEYIVGSVAKSVTIRGNGPNAFAKVIAALDAGQVPAKTSSQSSMFNKVQRDIPQTVDVETVQGTKTYYYVEPGKVDELVTKLYDQYGPDKYKEEMKKYATDRPSGDIHNPYIPITQTARQNVFRHKLGTRAGAINYKTR